MLHDPFSSSSESGPQNRLLASLPLEDYNRIAPGLRSAPMKLKQLIHKQDDPIEEVYFPRGGAFALVKTLNDGRVAATAMVGAEGVVGAGIFFGQRDSDCEVIVQLQSGGAQVMAAAAFMREMDNRSAFYNCVIRYTQALTIQMMQTTACNALHSAQRRCCRWLLMTRDRAESDTFALTHGSMATMLCLRRPTVTVVLANLRRAGLTEQRRGFLTIVDRPQLEAESCECYRTMATQMGRLLPERHFGLH